MNFITDLVLNAIEKDRPELADWCEDKRHELPDSGKLEALRWVVQLDEQNQQIAARALSIDFADLAPLQRVLQVI